LNVELKTKQSLIGKINEKAGKNGGMLDEIASKDKKIDDLNGKLVVLHHEMMGL
jgi:hypothetical protein